MFCPNCKTKLDVAEAEFKGFTEDGDQLDETIGHCFNCGSDFRWTSRYRTVLLSEYDVEEILY